MQRKVLHCLKKLPPFIKTYLYRGGGGGGVPRGQTKVEGLRFLRGSKGPLLDSASQQKKEFLK
jgi:hypothetical protein